MTSITCLISVAPSPDSVVAIRALGEPKYRRSAAIGWIVPMSALGQYQPLSVSPGQRLLSANSGRSSMLKFNAVTGGKPSVCGTASEQKERD
jgi:hypothetical protein